MMLKEKLALQSVGEAPSPSGTKLHYETEAFHNVKESAATFDLKSFICN
ncbi:hypothetical protein ACIQ7N_00955 [Lysinibacillus sp. NPDC095746]